MSQNNFKIEISRNTILIISGCVLVIIATLWYFNTPKNEKEYPFDLSIEMIDPQNPESAADEIIRLRRENNKLKNEKQIIENILDETDHNNTAINDLFEEIKKAVPNKIYNQSSTPAYNGQYIICKGNSLKLTSDAKNFLQSLEPGTIFSFHTDKAFYSPGGYVSSDGTNSDYRNTQTYLLCNQYYKKYKIQFNSLLNKFGSDNTGRNPISQGAYIDYYDNYYYDFTVCSTDTSDIPNKKRLIDFTDNIHSQIKSLNETLKKRSDTLNVMQKQIVENYTKKIDAYRSSRLDINDKAIKYGIIAFCSTALIMYLAGLYSRNKLKKNLTEGSITDTNYHEEFKTSVWYSVYMITVLLLIITIFILGLARLLGENSLAALLGGIAGYVLNNRMTDTNPTAKNPK